MHPDPDPNRLRDFWFGEGRCLAFQAVLKIRHGLTILLVIIHQSLHSHLCFLSLNENVKRNCQNTENIQVFRIHPATLIKLIILINAISDAAVLERATTDVNVWEMAANIGVDRCVVCIMLRHVVLTHRLEMMKSELTQRRSHIVCLPLNKVANAKGIKMCFLRKR